MIDDVALVELTQYSVEDEVEDSEGLGVHLSGAVGLFLVDFARLVVAFRHL